MTQPTKYSYVSPRQPCEHFGIDPVPVGPYKVRASGTMYWFYGWPDYPKDVTLVPLTNRELPPGFVAERLVLPFYMEDFGGVPEDWEELLKQKIVPRLADGRDLLVFCEGSHGRTGTFLASLIALLETPEETPDPIAAARERHCVEAVETTAQAEAIFALRDQPVPEHYLGTFRL